MFSAEQKRLINRFLLLLAGLLALLYCLAVFLYVARQPWKGFYVFADQRVARSYRHSPAREQGIHRGDLILSIDGKQVSGPLDVLRISKDLPKGQAVDIVFQTDSLPPRTARVEITDAPFPVGRLIWMFVSSIIITTAYVFHYRRSEDRPTMLFYLLCVLFSVSVMAAFSWNVIAGNLVLITPLLISGTMLAPVILHFFLIYPETSPLIRRFRLLGKLIYVPSLVCLLMLLVMLLRVADVIGGPSDPATIGKLLGTIRTLVLYQLGVTVAYCIASIISLWHCQQTTLHSDVKNQIKWVWWGVATAILPLIMFAALASESIAANIFGQLQFV